MKESYNPLENRNWTPGKETILNDWDRKVLLKGGKGVIEKILKDFNGGLPEAIIYPETSARPLFYLFDPLITKIANTTALPKPKIFFFNVSRPDSMTFDRYDKNASKEEILKGINDRIIEIKSESTDDTDWYMSESDKQFIINEYEDRKKYVDETFKKRPIEEERAREIKDYLKKMNIDISKIVFIDDYSHEGKTESETERAFGTHINFKYIYAGKYDDGNNAGFVQDENYPNNPSIGVNTKLTYSGNWYGDFRNSIGVTKNKDSKYVTPLRSHEGFNNEDQKDIALLREEMKKLGDELSQNF